MKLSFNSKLVRLEEIMFTDLVPFIASFNSKLVRLEVAIKFLNYSKGRFQFQTGAIRRHELAIYRNKAYTFQFQTGAIRSILWCASDLP